MTLAMGHRLDWKRLLSADREPRPNDPARDRPDEDEDPRTPFEQDHDRIIFSAPFRRLARKTQVHPMASNDHIHNRLTHSVEVASVGRAFAGKLAAWSAERSNWPDLEAADLSWILQSACLIHDLGNPPFGHAGENVIRTWAEDHDQKLFPPGRDYGAAGREAARRDWHFFEGNAQGFRLAARSDNPAAGYLRLTWATLGAALKYPWLSTDDRADTGGKHGVYSLESAVFERLVQGLGLRAGDGTVCRHPLSLLTEAADDICYRVLDLEDAVEMGICSEREVKDLFLDVTREAYDWMPIAQLRGQVIKELIGEAWDVFTADEAAIMAGARTRDLKADFSPEARKTLETISEIYERIFAERRKVASELGAYKVLGRILTAFAKTIHSIDAAPTYERIHFLSKRCIDLSWGRPHVEANMDRNYAWWLGQLMDFVSGLTDNYAMRLSREIGGH